jgi:ligand-binding sensor domain-containing protein
MKLRIMIMIILLSICFVIVNGFKSNPSNMMQANDQNIESRPVAANSDTIRWKIYNTSNSNIPSNYVTSITFDDSGTKWIGTESYGLAKFDGEKWTVYNSNNSALPSNVINAIAVDDSGYKWIGTGEGLVKFNEENWTVYNSNNSELPSNVINAIAVDDSGNKWIGTGEGLVKFNEENWTVYTIRDGAGSIVTDNIGTKWIGTRSHGLLEVTDTTLLNHSSPGWIVSLAIQNSCIWMGTYNSGLYLFGIAEDSLLEIYQSGTSGLPDDTIRCIAVDRLGNKWIATDDHGLAKFDGKNWTVYNQNNCKIPSDMVEFVTIDTEGNKWIGMTYTGLVKYGDTVWTNYCIANSDLPDDNITFIAIDDSGKKWIGTRYGGLAVLEEGSIVNNEKDAKYMNHGPNEFMLSQNYPNPFNPSTKITFTLPKTELVKLQVYNTLGQVVGNLVDDRLQAGSHEVEFNASHLPSGVYFYRLQAGEYVDVKKMILLK